MRWAEITSVIATLFEIVDDYSQCEGANYLDVDGHERVALSGQFIVRAERGPCSRSSLISFASLFVNAAAGLASPTREAQ
jgi:hypothetical protein